MLHDHYPIFSDRDMISLRSALTLLLQLTPHGICHYHLGIGQLHDAAALHVRTIEDVQAQVPSVE